MNDKNNPEKPTFSMNRREFIKTSSLVTGGLIVAPGVRNLFSADINDSISGALDVPLRVKVVNTGMVHEAAYEGSCRWGDLENLTAEAERKRLEENLKRIKSTIKSLQFPAGVEFLEPVSMNYWVDKGDPDIHIPHDQFDALTRDNPGTDLYVVSSQYAGVKIAENYKKPVIILQRAGWAVDMPAAIRQMGIPSFHVKTWDQLIDLLPLFKVQKSVQNTKLLNVTNFPSRVPWGVVSSVPNLQTVKDQYKMDYQYVDYKEFFRLMDKIVKDKDYQRQAGDLAKKLLQDSGNSNMTEEDVKHSVEFYQAVKAVMKENGCNAFTIECFELCSSMQPWNRRFTPCLTHALLKDNGIPSACEGDINALLAMMVETYLSRKAVYMGNPDVYPDDNTLTIHHSVASLNMNGFGKKDTPYDIHSFTKDGFGATLRHDFNKDKGRPVTVARFDPTATKILVSSGKIIGGTGMSGGGCSQRVDIRIPDAKTFWEESQDYGHHLAMVFGDYVDDIRKLGKIMNYKVNAVV
jgi:hypothetical protein